MTVTAAPRPVAPGHDEDHTQLFAGKGRIRELVFGSLDGLPLPRTRLTRRTEAATAALARPHTRRRVV